MWPAAAEEEELTEDDRPATERRPDWANKEAEGGEGCRLEVSLTRILRWWAGSLAFMASAKARDIYSTSEVGGY